MRQLPGRVNHKDIMSWYTLHESLLVLSKKSCILLSDFLTGCNLLCMTTDMQLLGLLRQLSGA